jgi:hypothetical protein
MSAPVKGIVREVALPPVDELEGGVGTVKASMWCPRGRFSTVKVALEAEPLAPAPLVVKLDEGCCCHCEDVPFTVKAGRGVPKGDAKSKRAEIPGHKDLSHLASQLHPACTGMCILPVKLSDTCTPSPRPIGAGVPLFAVVVELLDPVEFLFKGEGLKSTSPA